MSGRHVYELIDSVEVVNNIKMSAMADTDQLPKTESVVRPLVSLEPDDQYRRAYASFGDYVRGRWSMGSSQAYRLMDAVEVANNISLISVSPIGEIHALPKTENVLRPLVSVEPDDQRAAWAEACTGAASIAYLVGYLRPRCNIRLAVAA